MTNDKDENNISKENINFKSMTTGIQVRQPIFLYWYWLGNPPRRCYQESRQTEVYSSCSSSRRRGASWQMLRETFTAEQSKVARYIVHLSCFQCSPPYRTVKLRASQWSKIVPPLKIGRTIFCPAQKSENSAFDLWFPAVVNQILVKPTGNQFSFFQVIWPLSHFKDCFEH